MAQVLGPRLSLKDWSLGHLYLFLETLVLAFQRSGVSGANKPQGEGEVVAKASSQEPGTALGAVCSSLSQPVHCEHPPPGRPTGPGCWDHWQAAYYSCLSHPTLLEASTNPSPGRVRAEKTPVLEAVSRLFSHLK